MMRAVWRAIPISIQVDASYRASVGRMRRFGGQVIIQVVCLIDGASRGHSCAVSSLRLLAIPEPPSRFARSRVRSPRVCSVRALACAGDASASAESRFQLRQACVCIEYLKRVLVLSRKRVRVCGQVACAW